MRRLFRITIFLIILGYNCLGQEKLIPQKTIIQDKELNNFISELKNAVSTKNKEFIIKNLSPSIVNSFGGNGGIAEFKEYWCWSCPESNLWDLLKMIFELGGGPYSGGDTYSLPYIFSEWPKNEKYNPFEFAAIIKDKVEVRDNYNNEKSKIVGYLNYDIVHIDWEKSYPAFEEPKIEFLKFVGGKEWYFIETLDGKIKGFVYYPNLWSPIFYRIGFYKNKDKWEIRYLVAGD